MIETKLMMQAAKLLDNLRALWKTSNDSDCRRIFRITIKAEKRRERRIKAFVRRMNWRREDEILQADLIE